MMQCCDITAGKLKNRIELQELVITEDGAGGNTRSWKTIQKVWAMLRQTSGSERFQNDRLTAIANFKATIRYRADISPVNRIIFQGKAYQIRAVDNVEFANKFLDLTLENGVGT